MLEKQAGSASIAPCRGPIFSGVGIFEAKML
jgi:hypothetical protein